MASPAKIKATVAEVVKHNDSVASYRFAPQGRVPKFHAGQFLHIALDEYSPEAAWPESRVFSIASSPSARHEELAVTISVKGRFTERIFKTLEKGSECWLKLPYGEFLFPPDRHLVLIAGGVGITPLSFASHADARREIRTGRHALLRHPLGRTLFIWRLARPLCGGTSELYKNGLLRGRLGARRKRDP